MGLLDILSKKLTPELMTQVTDSLGDDFDDDMVPRARLNKVIKQRNDLRNQAGSKAQAGAERKEEDDDDDKGESKFKLEDYVSKKEHDKLVKELRESGETGTKMLKLQYAALDKLRGANAIDPELVYSSVLDKTKLSFDDKGALIGFDEQLPDIIKNKSFLFTSKEAAKGTGKGTGSDSSEDSAVETEIDKIFGNYGIQTEKG